MEKLGFFTQSWVVRRPSYFSAFVGLSVFENTKTPFPLQFQ